VQNRAQNAHITHDWRKLKQKIGKQDAPARKIMSASAFCQLVFHTQQIFLAHRFQEAFFISPAAQLVCSSHNNNWPLWTNWIASAGGAVELLNELRRFNFHYPLTGAHALTAGMGASFSLDVYFFY
jgi:hypothetical protein